jgi:hypothetical protein
MNNSLLSSCLYDNNNFYKVFEKDLKFARYSAIIESPFITARQKNFKSPGRSHAYAQP